MAKFSKISQKRLDTVHPILRRVMTETIKLIDFSVLCGFRGEGEQNLAFLRGASKVRFPEGKHNKHPSLAVDIAPHHPRFGLIIASPEQVEVIARELNKSEVYVRGILYNEFYYLAGHVMAVAESLNISLRWGGDWDRDDDFFDNRFNDLMHFELTTVEVSLDD